MTNYNLVARSSDDKTCVHTPGTGKDLTPADDPELRAPQAALTVAETTQLLKDSKQANAQEFQSMRSRIS